MLHHRFRFASLVTVAALAAACGGAKPSPESPPAEAPAPAEAEPAPAAEAPAPAEEAAAPGEPAEPAKVNGNT